MQPDSQGSSPKTGLPGGWSLAGGLLLVAALTGAIIAAWNSTNSSAHYTTAQGDLLLGDGRYSEAVSLLEPVLLTFDSPQLRLALSYAYLARRDGVRAERQARQAVVEAPPELKPAAWAQLGRVLYFEQHADEAIAAWKQAREAAAPYANSPSPAREARSSTWHIAVAYWQQGNWDAAQRELESLLGTSDIYATSACARLAQLLMPTAGDEAAHLLAQAGTGATSGTAVPDLRVPGLDEGLSRAGVAGLSASLLDARSQAASAQDQPALDVLWGSAYLREGESRLAKRYLDEAVALRPQSADARARLALSMLDLGDTKGALAQLTQAVQMDASAPLPHRVLAGLYLEQREYDSALSELNTLQKLEPDSMQLHLQIADYYRQIGEYDKAQGEYTLAVQLQQVGRLLGDPEGLGGDTDAALALARFYTDVRGQGCEALPAARQSIATHPGNPASLDAIGWSLALCGTPQDAIDPLKQAVGGAPDVARYRYHLARVYAVTGHISEAREQYRRTIDFDPTGPWERLATSDLVALRGR